MKAGMKEFAPMLLVALMAGFAPVTTEAGQATPPATPQRGEGQGRGEGRGGGGGRGAQAPAAPHRPTASDTEKTAAGEVKITPITHASVALEFAGKVIHVDPTGNYSEMPKADLILITDIHGDHMSAPSVEALKKPGTVIIAAPEVTKTITDAKPLANGATETVNLQGTNIRVEAIPSYNLTRGPAEGQFYHTKGRGNGYVVTFGDKRFFFAGDTECVPEIKALKNIDVAFLPMNLPFTMTPPEAADCVKAFRPKVVYPYHFRGQDVAVFAAALKGEAGIEVRQRAWYPPAPPPAPAAAQP